MERSDTDVNGCSLIMWDHADEGKWMISIEGEEGGEYDCYLTTGKYNDHAEKLPQVFNAAFRTQGDDFRGKPLAHFEQWVMTLFGKSIDELYALPKQ